jgi:hypothetical protein
VPGLYLTSIEQRDGEVTIKGESPNEYSVTKFGQSLEFSGGLFSNLNIETQREFAKEAKDDKPASGSQAAKKEENVVKPEVVVFTVKAKFDTPKAQSQQQPAPAAANQVAMKK